MALGATRSQAARSLLLEALQPVWLGLLAGAVTALIYGNVLQPHLYRVSSHDPWVLLLTIVLVGGEVMAAAYLAVFRALRLNPSQALRAD
jgi:ABC-type antimicrobial peptide transport system permease subunit